MKSMKSMNGMPSLQFWGAATVGAKGQIVIPREAREQLGIVESDKLVVMSTPDGKGAVLVKADVFEKTMMELSEQFAGVVKESKQKRGKS
jgi:AbrB family looped-hinge helix DNA binding protein